MAPVAGAVANAQKDGFILCSCFAKSFLAPGGPVYRVFRMLEKGWACLIFQMIAQILTSVFQIPHCGATAADAHYFSVPISFLRLKIRLIPSLLP